MGSSARIKEEGGCLKRRLASSWWALTSYVVVIYFNVVLYYVLFTAFTLYCSETIELHMR